VNKQPKQLMATAWKPGQSGNPAGRPIGARQKISEKLLADLAVVWETEGESVLRRLAIEDPGKLAQIAYGLLPRDVFISVEQRTPGNLDPDEWAILRTSSVPIHSVHLWIIETVFHRPPSIIEHLGPFSRTINADAHVEVDPPPSSWPCWCRCSCPCSCSSSSTWPERY